jgi:hypothetical protein
MKAITVILDNLNNDEIILYIPKDYKQTDIINYLNKKYTDDGWWCYE